MQYKITEKEEKTTKTGKPYIRATLTDEQGKVFTGISAFNGEFNVADTWHGELEQNGQYYNLVTPKKAAGGAYMANQKAQEIEKAMDKKAGQIAQAQDRSAWMWAKNNAAMLLANHPLFKDLRPQEIAPRTIELATKIYNGEPDEPFTSPSRDEPEVDMSDIPF